MIGPANLTTLITIAPAGFVDPAGEDSIKYKFASALTEQVRKEHLQNASFDLSSFSPDEPIDGWEATWATIDEPSVRSCLR